MPIAYSMERIIAKLARVSLYCIFLVIIAGSVVRMTGSGMGCPDWPKCFGYYIPPTSVEQLTWGSNRDFSKGHIIIRNESLWVAQMDFISGNNFDPENWRPYTKHNYAKFNASHTWTEYINRLTGAFSGLPVFLLFIASLFYIKKDRVVSVLSLLTLFFLGFEAWLGKMVVDGNLVPNQITIHMLGAVVLIALLIAIISRITPSGEMFPPKRKKQMVILLSGILILTLIQIVLGTQVREQIDYFDRTLSLERDVWIDSLSWVFEFHRTFSIVVFIANIAAAFYLFKDVLLIKYARYLVILIVLEIITGIVLTYFDLPHLMQPAHLLLAMFIFANQFFLLLFYLKKTEPRALELA